MQYTINEIQGGNIKVTFADNTWANVHVNSDDSAELIDERVGAYTREYVVAETPNTNVSVGEVRNTVNPVTAQAARDEEAKKNTPVYDPYTMNWGKTATYMDPADCYSLALKLAAAGDTSLLDMINARLQTIQDDPEFSLDDLKAAFNDTV